ncbi:MAG: hypothetical protein LKJ03_11020 [Enterococcaceae bacterium]|jgi:hypothetical protein|nr:hypothetical protein [Enterococcaceae bacterium]MCI1920138.1 hypothetical protein [Enterococcaceae bacterium]
MKKILIPILIGSACFFFNLKTCAAVAVETEGTVQIFLIDKTHEKYVEQMTWPANNDFGKHPLPKTSGNSKALRRQKEKKLPKLGEAKGGLLTLSGIVLIALLYLVKEAERKKRRN